MSSLNIIEVNTIPELVGERLTIRPLTDEDYVLYSELYGNAEILRFIAPALSTERLQSSFKKAVTLSQASHCKRSFLVVTDKCSDAYFGILGLTVFPEQCCIEIGVIFRPEYQKQHFAYEALQVLINFLCDKYTEYDIIATVNAENRAALWLAKRLGFVYNNSDSRFELDKKNRPSWGK